MKKIIFFIVLLVITLTVSAQNSVIAHRLLINNGNEQNLHTLTANVPYTITHSKDGKGSFTVNENGAPLGSYPESATIKSITVALKNTWLTNGLNKWTEENKKSDNTSTAPILELDDTNLPSGAPAGAKCVKIRNLYSAVIEAWFYQEVLYLPAGTYTFSVQAAGSVFSSASAYLYAEENNVKTASYTPINFSGGAWTTSTFTYTTNGGAVKFGIYINKFGTAEGLGGSNVWRFTNFSLAAQSGITYDKVVAPPVIPTVDESDYTAYYVDPVNGNDDNNGLSTTTAFKTLLKINEMVRNPLPPRTKVLLKSGAVFNLDVSYGLVLKNLSGTESKPFILDIYGGTERPTINGIGDQALLIQDGNCRVRNIKFTNKTGTRGIRLQTQLKGSGALKNVEINACRIEEVNWAGSAAVEGVNPANLNVESIAPGARFSTKEYGGIILETFTTKEQGASWFENIWMTNNEFYKVCRQGIMITARWGQRDKPGNGLNEYIDDEHNWYPSKNIVIQGNDLNYIGGDGVVIMGSTNSWIDHNRCYNANFLGRGGQASAGMWPYCCTNIVMQYNEAAYTWLANSSNDGQGLDVDMACKNTLVQYNYVHHNKGGGILLCNLATGDHTGTVIRNNVFSLNEGSYRGSLATISGSVGKTDIYNNIIILNPATPKVLLSDDWPKAGKSTDISFMNNIFMAASPCSATFDRGNINVLNFANNLFHQVGSLFSLDPTARLYNPKVTIPSSPDGYAQMMLFRPAEPNVFKDGLLFDGMPEKDAAGVPAYGIKYLGAFAK